MNIKKIIPILVVGILVLSGLGISAGESSSRDDTTPPVTTCTLDPAEPDGLNDWYVSDVTITLNATDDMSGVNAIYYRVDSGEWKNHNGEHLIFIVDKDGEYVIEYYSVDNAGNIEDIKSETIRIDQTPPIIDVTWKSGGWNKIKFTASVFDETSGIDKVEFYLNKELKHIDNESPYEWIVNWKELPEPKDAVTFDFYVYDIAGLFSTAKAPDNFHYYSHIFSNKIFIFLLQLINHIYTFLQQISV